ncbi:hypothetical protein FHR32_003802 [Streptosporangium album]|uniref:Uncharacterized protein n=1 Tax=Streptosporangium album TaxID=47479 RepID=A0A7W7RWP4_9ACTN|nr:hypothetical protein [Streptosporangium album]MBB4939497.1 hypothetical protein [Streptosporangium album]
MRTILSKAVAAAAALALAAALAPAAHAAARAEGSLKLVFGSLQANDLEESGEDEIRVELKEPNGDKYYIWPTNGDEADTRAGTCWVWTSDAASCSYGYTQRSAGPYSHLTVTSGASFTIEVWEDDHIGDDLLLRVPVTATGGTQYIDVTTPAGKGFSYTLVARLVPA